MKKLLSVMVPFLLMGIKGSFAATYKYSSLYGTYLNYDKGSKDWGYSITGYYYQGNDTDGYEFGLSFTSIAYADNTTVVKNNGRRTAYINNVDFLNQGDFTFVYTNTNRLLKNHIFKFGLHYILTDDILTNNGVTFYFDGTYYKPYNYNSGIELTYSYYPESISLGVVQISPHIGKYFFTSSKTFYLGLKTYFIKPNHTADLGISSDWYKSLEGSVYVYDKKYSVGAGVWFGKQVFAVKNSGFVVYNLSEEFKGGGFLTATYNLNDRYKLTGTVAYNKLYDLEAAEDVNQVVTTVSLGYRW